MMKVRDHPDLRKLSTGAVVNVNKEAVAAARSRRRLIKELKEQAEVKDSVLSRLEALEKEVKYLRGRLVLEDRLP